VPGRIDGEQDLQWGNQPDGTRELNGDRSSLRSFALSLQSGGKLPFTPVLPAGIDVGPTVYAMPNSAPDVYDALLIVYASARYGWFGIWERQAYEGEAASYLQKQLALCAPPVQCQPASPKQVSLESGAQAMLTDPGGVTWTQNGLIFALAGPWASFDATRSVPLANAISEASAVAAG
jgi:hypothetical protein